MVLLVTVLTLLCGGLRLGLRGLPASTAGTQSQVENRLGKGLTGYLVALYVQVVGIEKELSGVASVSLKRLTDARYGSVPGHPAGRSHAAYVPLGAVPEGVVYKEHGHPLVAGLGHDGLVVARIVPSTGGTSSSRGWSKGRASTMYKSGLKGCSCSRICRSACRLP